MSLATQLSALAVRIAQEFKTLRTEISANQPGKGDTDGGGADAYYGWQNIGIDNGNAATVILDGVYIDGGAA
jgi:hypothetical protein